ncbi:MAG: hypothetical protein NTW40_04250 [Acidobacteria bacterium]|nr:hypothetical protein [Acidobacteriota bacterium]
MKTMRNHPAPRQLTLPLASLLALVGCMKAPQPAPSEAPPAGPVMATTVATSPRMVKDIPMPPDAKADADKTLIMGQGEAWTGRLVMTTSLSSAEACTFFQERMDGSGWRLISATQAKISILTFLRGDRVASIQIEGRLFTGSTIMVIVAPVQGAAPTVPGTPANN